jgi:hypothetical protein
LVKSGHSWSDIQEYTLAQFKAFLKSAEKAIRIEQAMLLQATTVGAAGDGKMYKKMMSDLLD